MSLRATRPVQLGGCSAGRLFGVSAATAVRLAAEHREHGTTVPKPQGRPAGQFGKRAPHRGFLPEIVQAEPDITLRELAAALAETHGVEMQLSSLHRALERAGLSYKKDRSRRNVTDRRCARPAVIGSSAASPACDRSRVRLVFIETAVKTNFTRPRGRAPVGERLYGAAPFGKWGTQTFIAGPTQDAPIAPRAIKGAMNGPAFDTCIETQLAPALDPGTVVIIDNLST